MEEFVILCKIAVQHKIESDSIETFKYSDKEWRPLGFLQIGNELQNLLHLLAGRFVTDKRLMFVLKEIINDDATFLAVAYKVSHVVVTRRQLRLLHIYVKQELFPIIFKDYDSHYELDVREIEWSKGLGEEENEYDKIESQKLVKKYVTTKLYDKLYESHMVLSSDVYNESVLELPKIFKPILRPYQEQSVRWLLQREQTTRYPAFYTKLQAKDDSSIIYKHRFCFHMLQSAPEYIDLPPGGILADEMGLGKTVEVLALILLHPRVSVCDSPPPVLPELESNVEGAFPRVKRLRVQPEVYCICGSISVRNILQCERCTLWQHTHCVANYNGDHEALQNEPYLCPSCWYESASCSRVETGATFIVSPHTIKTQWFEEIQKHIHPAPRVLLYKGAAAGWISPRQLGNYDIVLTDYNILVKEFYHTPVNESTRVTRNKPRSMRVNSPLLLVHWWRVCLDEAQMVESNVSKVAALVRLLPAVNRWAVTGTPIQRTLDDLQTLLEFVGFEAACWPKDVWSNLVNDFVLNHESPQKSFALIEVLQKCMWRTCKSKVVDQLNIPPQNEIVHRIDLGNLEKLFYSEQHAECETKFNSVIDKYFDRAHGIKHISPQAMKIILQPLLKIRQCCNMPVVTDKQFLQPQELHTHLVLTNEYDCKSELRSMASSYNALAAIHFIREEYGDAIKYYQAVLKLASDYAEKNISVDSLLQIHALHNMQEVFRISPQHAGQLPAEIISQYQQQIDSLEWKYLGPYAAALRTTRMAYEGAIEAITTIEAQTNETIVDFLGEILQMNSKDTNNIYESLQDRINEEILVNQYDSEKVRAMYSFKGLVYVVATWYQKVVATKKKIGKMLKDLEFFVDNVRIRNEVGAVARTKIKKLVNNVYECHLRVLRDGSNRSIDENTDESAPSKKNLCKLCTLRDLYNEYECLMFNKVIDEETNQTEGLANPSMQIHFLKVILTFIKSKFKELFHQRIDKHMEMLDCLQGLYKKISTYWIEIEYTVKAYDELDMCKMRLQLIDDRDATKQPIFQITRYELDETYSNQLTLLHETQREFAVKLARLRYLKHLESKDDPGACPICRSEDDLRYAVLECGHHLCLTCLKSLRQYISGQNLTCSICRNKQTSRKIYYVTREPIKQFSDDSIQINGRFSSKIESIVLSVLKLKRDEPNVKILIFSQWEFALRSIAVALFQNKIEHRVQNNLRTIDEFKDSQLNITCLLMLLSRGSKGLNLIEATHVFLVEPILNPGDELQAIGRVHRFGQTKPTTVHRFIVTNTIEENLFHVVMQNNQSQTNWNFDNMNIQGLRNLFKLNNEIEYQEEPEKGTGQ